MKKSRNSLLVSVLLAIYGIVLIIWPKLNADLIAYVIVALIMIYGISFIIRYIRNYKENFLYKKDLVVGIVIASIALILFFKIEIIESIIPVLLGIFVLISGTVKLQNALDMKRFSNSSLQWKIAMVLSIVSIILGFSLLIRPIWLVDAIFRIIGIALLYSGLSDIITFVMYRRGFKQYENANGEIFQAQPKK